MRNKLKDTEIVLTIIVFQVKSFKIKINLCEKQLDKIRNLKTNWKKISEFIIKTVNEFIYLFFYSPSTDVLNILVSQKTCLHFASPVSVLDLRKISAVENKSKILRKRFNFFFCIACNIYCHDLMNLKLSAPI